MVKAVKNALVIIIDGSIVLTAWIDAAGVILHSIQLYIQVMQRTAYVRATADTRILRGRD